MSQLQNDDAVLVNYPTKKESSSARKQWHWLAALFGACIVGLTLFYGQDTKLTVEEVQRKPSAPNDCSDACVLKSLNPAVMLERVTRARSEALEHLQKDYGEYYNDIFLNGEATVGRTAYVSANEETDISRKRMIRKLKMKLLSVQIQSNSVADGCKCEEDSLQRRQVKEASYLQRFVWANGGHSASAGHGNFHNESYTAVMERTAKPVFASVGIDLEGRNYAMGGMDSAPELALCQEAVFGLDADIISWDFGMTDGRAYFKKFLYENRVGVHVNRPAIVENHLISRVKGARVDTLKQVEAMGLTAMYAESETDTVKGLFPDMQTMTEDAISQLPDFVRNFRCGNSPPESGDPTCGADKYTKTSCTIKGRVKWHPGWKSHALEGNLMALFIIETLIDAVTELQNSQDQDAKTLLEELRHQEDLDYAKFFGADVKVDEYLIPKEIEPYVNGTMLYRSQAICHTAILPAQSRYLGIVTDTRESSSFENYEKGVDSLVALKSEPSDTWRLTYNAEARNPCPVTDRIDFKDYFFLREKDGEESSLTFPTEAEKETYRSKNMHGLLIICLVNCPWGKCKTGYMSADHIRNGNVTLKVNGEQVTELSQMSACSLLRGKDGFFWKPNDRGQYKLTAELLQPNSFLQVSSIILI